MSEGSVTTWSSKVPEPPVEGKSSRKQVIPEGELARLKDECAVIRSMMREFSEKLSALEEAHAKMIDSAGKNHRSIKKNENSET